MKWYKKWFKALHGHEKNDLLKNIPRRRFSSPRRRVKALRRRWSYRRRGMGRRRTVTRRRYKTQRRRGTTKKKMALTWHRRRIWKENGPDITINASSKPHGRRRTRVIKIVKIVKVQPKPKLKRKAKQTSTTSPISSKSKKAKPPSTTKKAKKHDSAKFAKSLQDKLKKWLTKFGGHLANSTDQSENRIRKLLKGLLAHHHAKQASAKVGATFVVSAPLTTIDEAKLTLKIGDKGTVLAVDDAGDLRVHLPSYPTYQFYFIDKADLPKIGLGSQASLARRRTVKPTVITGRRRRRRARHHHRHHRGPRISALHHHRRRRRARSHRRRAKDEVGTLYFSGAGSTYINGKYSKLPAFKFGTVAWQKADGSKWSMWRQGNHWLIGKNFDTPILYAVKSNAAYPPLRGWLSHKEFPTMLGKSPAPKFSLKAPSSSSSALDEDLEHYRHSQAPAGEALRRLLDKHVATNLENQMAHSVEKQLSHLAASKAIGSTAAKVSTKGSTGTLWPPKVASTTASAGTTVVGSTTVSAAGNPVVASTTAAGPASAGTTTAAGSAGAASTTGIVWPTASTTAVSTAAVGSTTFAPAVTSIAAGTTAAGNHVVASATAAGPTSAGSSAAAGSTGAASTTGKSWPTASTTAVATAAVGSTTFAPAGASTAAGTTAAGTTAAGTTPPVATTSTAGPEAEAPSYDPTHHPEHAPEHNLWGSRSKPPTLEIMMLSTANHTAKPKPQKKVKVSKALDVVNKATANDGKELKATLKAMKSVLKAGNLEEDAEEDQKQGSKTVDVFNKATANDGKELKATLPAMNNLVNSANPSMKASTNTEASLGEDLKATGGFDELDATLLNLA